MLIVLTKGQLLMQRAEDGTVTAFEGPLDPQQAAVQAGTLAVVPALTPHSVKNIGEETLRVVGFFSSSTVLSVFDEPLEPFATRYFTTPMIEEEATVTAA